MSAAGEGELGDGQLIEVADAGLVFRRLTIKDRTPTGAQLAAAAGIRPQSEAIVLCMLPDGSLEDIRPDEVADLRKSNRFIIVASDRTYRFSVDEQRLEWPCGVISGATLRKLANVASDSALVLEHENEADREIEDCDLVDLSPPSLERFHTRKRSWTLKVQNVSIESTAPKIVVRDAISQAGLDPTAPWHIFLKVAGLPKREVPLDYVVDLTTPGIEKLRLTPKDVNNGEAPAHRRQFSLLDPDHAYLNKLGLRWETVIEGSRRFLLIHGYPTPEGYSVDVTLLALEIPPTYPGAQIYGFYVYPPLALRSGRTIDRTQMRATIDGAEFHGWSRRSSVAWNPSKDNVSTQLMLVDAALAREVGE